jgi:hypothetical protein
LKIRLQHFLFITSLLLPCAKLLAQSPNPGTVTFAGVATNTTVRTSTTGSNTYVSPQASITNGAGLEYTMTGTTSGTQTLQMLYTTAGNLTFTRSGTAINITEVRIRSAATGSASKSTTPLNATGGQFDISSIAVARISANVTLTFEGYKNGVLVATQSQAFTTTTKVAMPFTDGGFNDIDDLVITGFGGTSGIVVDDIIILAAAPAPVISYATPQTYYISAPIITLSPTVTGTGTVGTAGYATSTNFAAITDTYEVDVDASGNVYSVNGTNGNLYKYNSDGVGGLINNTSLVSPSGLAVDGLGNIYVSDFVGGSTYNVLKFSNTGTLIGTTTGFDQPYGIAFDAANNAYVANTGTNSIIKINAGTTTKSTYIGGLANAPYGLAIDPSGNMYIGSNTGNNIVKVAAGGTVVSNFVLNTAGLSGPRHLDTDPLGNVYVSDYGNDLLKKVTPAGLITSLLPTAQISNPRGVALDPWGNLYFANNGTNFVKKAVPTGLYFIDKPLPAGLIFNSTNGQISGTPTVASAATDYTITAYNATGGNSTILNITVLGNQAPVITSNGAGATATIPVGEYDTAVTTAIATDLNTSQTITYSISGANASSFTINSVTGVLTLNSPAVALSSYTVVVTATDNGSPMLSDTQTLTINVTGNSLSGYAYHLPVTLQSSGITGVTGNLSNFPVLVKVVNPVLVVTAGSCTNKVQFPNGPSYDIAFTDESGTELNYQLESYNAATGTLIAWVKVPTLYYQANTVISLYFGKAIAPTNHTTAFSQATWGSVTSASAAYKGVWHFNDAPSTSAATMLDATGTNNGLTASSVSTAVQNTNSLIQNGITLSGGTLSKTTALNIPAVNSAYSMSVWVNYATYPTLADNVMTVQNGTASAQIGFRGTSTSVSVNKNTGTQIVSSGITPNINNWHYLVYTYNGTNTNTIFVDGTAVSSTVAPNTGTPNTVVFGSYIPGGPENFRGTIDEARVINTNLSKDWVLVEYKNQYNPVSFCSVGSLVSDPLYVVDIPGGVIYTYNGGIYTPNVSGVSTVPSGNGKESFIFASSLSVINYTMYSLTVNPGVTVSLNGATLNVNCNVVNNGLINYSTNPASEIKFTGSDKQSYTGTNFTNTAQLGNLTVANTSGATVTITGGPIDVYNTLTLTNGSLFVDNTNSGALTLKSTATATARVAEITTNTKSISGNVTVERWFTGGAGKRGWRLMSSPVNNSGSLPATSASSYNFSSLQTNLPVTGPNTTTGNGFDRPGTYTANGPTILLYNTGSFIFASPPTIASTTNVGLGFYFYFRGDRTSILSKLVRASTSVPFPDPETNIVGLQTGTLNQQGFTLTLSNSGRRYNQLGNPYASSISIDGNSTTTFTGISPFVYTYTTGNSIVPQGVATTIASGQGFYVRTLTTGPSSVTFAENLKVATQPTGAALLLGLPVGTKEPILSLKMIQDSSNYDVTHLRFLDTYKAGFDEKEDAEDINGQGQAVLFSAVTADNYLVGIASQPLQKQRTSVFLSVNDNTSGLYSIKRMDLSGIPAVYNIWLMDHFKKDSLDLRANDTYAFNIDKANTETYGNSRFEVVIAKKSLPPYKLVSFKGTRSGTDVQLNWNTLNEYDYTTFELQKSTDGITFDAVKNMQSTSKGSYTLKDVYASTKDVYYRLKQVDINEQVYYSNIVIISAIGEGTLSIFPNPASNSIQFRLKDDLKASVRLKIFNSMGILMKSNIFATYTGQQDISSLLPGSYTIELTDLSSKKVLLSGKFIKL